MSNASQVAVALPQALRILGSVVAQATLLGTLMFFFGRLHATSFFAYLGVHFSVFEFTTLDYLVRSQDGLFVPLAAIAGVALTALWVYRQFVTGLLAGVRPIMLRVRTPLAAVAGLVGIGVAIVGIVDPEVFTGKVVIPGLSLAGSVLLLAYACRPRHSETAPYGQFPAAVAVVEWAAVFILVSVGLFWAVGNYSAAVGTGRGQELERTLSQRPDAVLFSEKGLSLHAPGVREVRCQDGDSAYRFRYDQLKLVIQAGDYYLFLPAGWTRADGQAILVPRSPALRLEFSQASSRGAGRSPTC